MTTQEDMRKATEIWSRTGQVEQWLATFRASLAGGLSFNHACGMADQCHGQLRDLCAK